MSAEQIDRHLQPFRNGVTKICATLPLGPVGPPGGTFVIPKRVADQVIAKAGGDVSKLEALLSLKPGTLGEHPIRIDIARPYGLRIPSGDEYGANRQWRPGGYTKSGIPEATIDTPQPGEYWCSNIFK